MKRVLLITDIFPPDIGGPATFINHLGHGLVSQGYQVTVICHADHAQEPSDRQRPFRVRRVLRTGFAPIARLSLAAALLQELPRHHDVLVNGLESATYRVARLIRRHYILKIVGDSVWEFARNQVLTIQSIDAFQQSPDSHRSLTRLAERRQQYLAYAQHVITPSIYLQRLVTGWLRLPPPISVVYNGVRLELYDGYAPTRRTADTLELAFCGRLTNWKGVDTLLHSAAQMPHCRVHILGDGPELVRLTALAQQIDLGSRVRFYGRLNHDALCDVLARMHGLVLMSQYEGFSHTLLEAGAIGLPCIASDRGGNPEIITHERNGLLVPYGDVDALRGAIERLHHDEDFRYRMACQAQEDVRRFDFQQTINQTIQVLTGV